VDGRLRRRGELAVTPERAARMRLSQGDAESARVTTALAAADDAPFVPESPEALPAGAPVGSCGLDRP